MFDGVQTTLLTFNKPVQFTTGSETIQGSLASKGLVIILQVAFGITSQYTGSICRLNMRRFI